VIYLSGAITQTMLANPRPDLGVMLQPGMGNLVDLKWLPFAADNGCFAQGERFDVGDWLEWVASLRRFRERCLFVVAPDVFGDGPATMTRSRSVLPTIRQFGFRAALVAQPGVSIDDMPWCEFDCLFLGGPDEWQLSTSASAIVSAAQARGKWTHRGRVNSLRRLQATQVSSFDSADGTFVKFGPDRNLPQVYDWLDQVNRQAVLA